MRHFAIAVPLQLFGLLQWQWCPTGKAIAVAGCNGAIVTNRENRYTTEQRSYAAAMLLPYQHSKMSSVPAPVYLSDPVEFPYPRPASIAEATDNIAYIDKLFTTGALDLVSYSSLKETQQKYINTMIDEAKLIAAQGGSTGDQVIRIEGGLPRLPGTSITMPGDEPVHQLNGHASVLEHNSATAHPATDDPSGPPHKRGPLTSPYLQKDVRHIAAPPM